MWNKRRSEIIKKVINWITTVVVVIAVVLAILLVGVRAFGYKPFFFESGSMSPEKNPEYNINDLIYVKAEEFDKIKVGDVITYVKGEDKMVVTHRVVGIDKENRSFTTKGDANKNNDSAPVIYENVVGTVRFSIPMLGSVSKFFSSAFGRYIAIGFIAFMILLLLLPEFIKLYGKKPESRKEKEPVPEDEDKKEKNED